MKLLVLTEDFYPDISGGAHAQWRFCQLAAERGHDIVVFTPRIKGTVRRETVEGVRIRRPLKAKPDSVPADMPLAVLTRLFHSVGLLFYLFWWLHRNDVDAVYSGSNMLHWVATVLGSHYEVPSTNFVGYTPSLRPEKQSKIKLRLERLNFERGLSPSVFCRVPEIRDIIQKRSPAERQVEIIHGILNADRIESAHESATERNLRAEYASPEEKLLVFVGRLTEVKNVSAAVRTIADLPDEYRLVIVGDGPEYERVESEIDRCDVNNRVRMVGELPHEEALAVVAAADGLLLPSHTEAYPTVVFEALSLGCEVFATPVGILPEVSHERLHRQSVGDFPTEVERQSLDATGELDEETLESYTMKRYTDTILSAIADADGE